jgi:sterol desaturase/sphingolipid hydroxylase (fatty acid hydroxylase superfamily)
MNIEFVTIFCTFWLLALLTILNPRLRTSALRRGRTQWLVDFMGLTLHGTIVPLFQTFVIFAALSFIFPQYKGSLKIPGIVAFVLNFVVVDYLYYWNHRIFHRSKLWRFHSLHHSGTGFDVFTTSRNSMITTFLTLYIWLNGTMIFLLDSPTGYLWGIALSNCLDLFRHSGMNIAWTKFPFNFLVSPVDHAWHHGRDSREINFGGNFNIWDKLHGSYVQHESCPPAFGDELKKRQLWSAFFRGIPR